MAAKKTLAFGLLSAVLTLAACAPSKKSAPPADRMDASGRGPSRISLESESEALLARFEKAVLSHDTAKVLELLDGHYRGKELEDLYQNQAGAFLNDFFCGQVMGQDQHYCLVFKDIQELQRMGTEVHPEEIIAHYIVKSTAHEIRTKITVAVRKTYTFGVLGSKGYTQVE